MSLAACVPDVADIHTTLRLLESLGARVEQPAPGEILVDASGVHEWHAPYDLVRRMRASFLALGPLLARFGRARVATPGGCAIGSRPVDLHVQALVRLGAKMHLEHGDVEARAERLVGGHVILAMPSVGATENLLMAASLARGTTRIENAAREPEIVDLAEALSKMGAAIDGAGSSIIEVTGRDRLGGFDHEVVADRIVAGTWLIAGAIAGGDVHVPDARAEHLEALLEVLDACGCTIDSDDGIRVRMDDKPRPLDISTSPHPGFPTDLQAQIMALATQASGESTIDEHIFENRFMHVQELARMGADIRLHGHRAVVHGGVPLSGAPVMATGRIGGQRHHRGAARLPSGPRLRTHRREARRLGCRHRPRQDGVRCLRRKRSYNRSWTVRRRRVVA